MNEHVSDGSSPSSPSYSRLIVIIPACVCQSVLFMFLFQQISLQLPPIFHLAFPLSLFSSLPRLFTLSFAISSLINMQFIPIYIPIIYSTHTRDAVSRSRRPHKIHIYLLLFFISLFVTY